MARVGENLVEHAGGFYWIKIFVRFLPNLELAQVDVFVGLQSVSFKDGGGAME